jgi:phytoene synthase
MPNNPTSAPASAGATVEQSNYPDLRDPRVIVAVPQARRAALSALWGLAARLTRLLIDAREPLIGQIKLAWWRDMMAMLASDPAALPKGEPLLAELQASWAGQGGLDALVDAAEAMLLAESDAERRAASESFGGHLFALSGGAESGGRRWGLLWGAEVAETEADARRLLGDAKDAGSARRSDFAGSRALLMLDRWAGAIARRGGERDLRGEGLLLLRIGLFGR